jgi:hypothetical protein
MHPTRVSMEGLAMSFILITFALVLPPVSGFLVASIRLGEVEPRHPMTPYIGL